MRHLFLFCRMIVDIKKGQTEKPVAKHYWIIIG